MAELINNIAQNIAQLDMKDWRQLEQLTTKLYELKDLNNRFRIENPRNPKIPETRIHDNLLNNFIKAIDEIIFEIQLGNPLSSSEDSSPEFDRI